MITDTKVKFKGWNCLLALHRYGNGRIALVLVDEEDGSQIAVASVNLPDHPLDEGEIFIKDWSENEGMLEALVEAGVILDTGLAVRSGFVAVPVAELLIDIPKEEAA